MISKNIPPHLLPLPPGDAGHDEGEGVVDVLVDQHQQGDAVCELSQHKLRHGDEDCEDEDCDQAGDRDQVGRLLHWNILTVLVLKLQQVVLQVV